MTRVPQRIYVAQGEHALGDSDDVVISAILGSCVAVCLWDRRLGLGGMNHVLLPDVPSIDMSVMSIGAAAMERLINAMLKRGAVRQDMVAKVFGGAAVVDGLSDIGASNVTFVRGFLLTEGIGIAAESTGGTRACQVRFWPASGRAQRRVVRAAHVEPRRPSVRFPAGHDVELF